MRVILIFDLERNTRKKDVNNFVEKIIKKYKFIKNYNIILKAKGRGRFMTYMRLCKKCKKIYKTDKINSAICLACNKRPKVLN